MPWPIAWKSFNCYDEVIRPVHSQYPQKISANYKNIALLTELEVSIGL
jgi:hypothetical protein